MVAYRSLETSRPMESGWRGWPPERGMKETWPVLKEWQLSHWVENGIKAYHCHFYHTH